MEGFVGIVFLGVCLFDWIFDALEFGVILKS